MLPVSGRPYREEKGGGGVWRGDVNDTEREGYGEGKYCDVVRDGCVEGKYGDASDAARACHQDSSSKREKLRVIRHLGSCAAALSPASLPLHYSRFSARPGRQNCPGKHGTHQENCE